MYPCKYRPPSESSLDSCQKEKLRCAKKKGASCCCKCPRMPDPYELCKDNLRDITESIAQILEIIGIQPDIANPSKQLIFALFHHYDYARWSYEQKEPERICKEHIMHILMKVFEMDPVESEMTYYVTKRAFKAYFSNKCKKGLANAALDMELTAQDSAAWRHAAFTTARIIEEHDPLLPRLQEKYEQKIRQIYCDLVKKMRKRVDPLMVPSCKCKSCVSSKVPRRTDFKKEDIEPNDNALKKKQCTCSICAPYKGGKLLTGKPMSPKTNKVAIFGVENRDCKGRPVPSVPSDDGICKNDARKMPPPEGPAIPWCYKCKIYKMICDCEDNGNRESQGPFETFWVRVYDDEDDVIRGNVRKDPEHHHCPVDCGDLSLMSSSSHLSDSEEEEEEDICTCCDGDEEEEETTDDEERDANFVQQYCYCQKQDDDIGI